MSLTPPALAVFDLETTGVDVTSARIVTAFVGVLGVDGTVISSRSWLADPGVEIPAGAAAIHGVTTERARAEGRSANLVVREIVDELAARAADGLPLVVYNAPYDLTLLKHEARRHHAGPFVAENARKDSLGVRTRARELVGVTDAGRLDLDEHLGSPRSFDFDVLDR